MLTMRLAITLVALLAAGCDPGAESPQPAAETNGAVPIEPGLAEPSPGDSGGDVPAPAPAAVSPCLVQDGEQIPANAIRAIGTEPFWGARVEGRCVTYSHPDDQAGTRVWTKFSGTAESGIWTGALGGRPFVMRTRPQPGCSDGMSDNRYPIAVELTVGGEERSGCAQPL